VRWLIGRFGAFRPKGRRVESLSSHHIGTLGKSFTRRCLWRFGVKFRHSTFKLPIYLETVNYTLNNVYYDNLACLIVMVMFDSAAVCSLTTESLQYSLIVTSCGLTAVYCIKPVVHNVRPAGHIRPATSCQVARRVQQEKLLF